MQIDDTAAIDAADPDKRLPSKKFKLSIIKKNFSEI